MIFIWKQMIVATVPNIIADLKAEVMAEGLLREVNDLGTDIMCTCPFHGGGQERKPSMGISKQEVERDGKQFEAGTVHCYSCGWKGDLPKFVAELLGLSDRLQGFRWLMSRYNYGSADERAEIELNMDREKMDKQEEVLVTHYQRYLRQSEKAKAYLRRRKLSDEVVELFGIGYDPEFDSIVMPIPDRRGVVLMVKARSLVGKNFSNTKGSAKAGLLFGLYQAMQEDKLGERRLWVVESEIDAMTLWSWGEIAVAIMGSHISDKQIEELCKSRFRKVIAGLDNDEAGRKGIRHLKDVLIPKGFRIDNVRWNTSKKDINELEHEEFLNCIELY